MTPALSLNKKSRVLSFSASPGRETSRHSEKLLLVMRPDPPRHKVCDEFASRWSSKPEAGNCSIVDIIPCRKQSLFSSACKALRRGSSSLQQDCAPGVTIQPDMAHGSQVSCCSPGTWLLTHQSKAAGSTRAQPHCLQKMLHRPQLPLLWPPYTATLHSSFSLSRIYTSRKTGINKGKNVRLPCTLQEVQLVWAAPDSAIPWRISVFGAWEHIMLHAMPCHTPLSPASRHSFRSSIFACGDEVGKVFISKNLFREKKKAKY